MTLTSNKAIIALSMISIVLLLSASLTSAYTFTNQNSNQQVRFRSTEQNAVYPSYTFSPDTYSRAYNYNNIGDSYNMKYQGPLSERTTSYQVRYTQSTRGAISYSVSETTREKYSGEVMSLVKASQDRSDWGSMSSSTTSTNPTTSNGGSFWRYEPYYYSSSNSGSSSGNRYWY
jgi:hypothetical protein